MMTFSEAVADVTKRARSRGIRTHAELCPVVERVLRDDGWRAPPLSLIYPIVDATWNNLANGK